MSVWGWVQNVHRTKEQEISARGKTNCLQNPKMLTWDTLHGLPPLKDFNRFGGLEVNGVWLLLHSTIGSNNFSTANLLKISQEVLPAQLQYSGLSDG